MNQVSRQHGQSADSGIVISALRGGSGKTVLSIGIIAALRNLGHTVAPFKKGPDYIDAGWLALAAGRPCYNLDTFLIDQTQILGSFHTHTRNANIAVVEGNRGLYDAPTTGGETSTAELAKLLGLPVILCIDCTKTTRTMAAVVSGCDMFDPDVNIKGVILNRVAGTRHESILRRSIEEHCSMPVLGALPKLREQHFPERHMGLVPTPEHDWAVASIRSAAEMAERYLDLSRLIETAGTMNGSRTQVTGHKTVDVERRVDDNRPVAEIFSPTQGKGKYAPELSKPRIGIIRDSAFQFYYPENIEALETAGARIVYTSPLTDAALPDLDGLYIGGGFPETHADDLSRNTAYRNEIKRLANQGLPIYAECGGLMYLGRELVLEKQSYPMAGVLPFVFGFSKKPQGHGYTVLTVEGENPYYPVGTELKGHEFHYSSVMRWSGEDASLVFRMNRGNGIANRRDGASFKNVLATYTHIHALGMPRWAETVVQVARTYRQRRGK